MIKDSGDNVILQAILPVYMRKKGSLNDICTYAFFDPGSTCCFIIEELTDHMNLSGENTMLQLSTIHGVSQITRTTTVNDLVISY